MSKGNPAWKLVLTVLSILLTIFVWTKGLQESFDRPSVNPTLSLHQREISVLAEPAFPDPLKELFFASDPLFDLKSSLQEIPLDQISERNRLLLANLDIPKDDKDALLDIDFKDNVLRKVKLLVHNELTGKDAFKNDISKLKIIKDDPLLYQTSCFSLGGTKENCIDQDLSKKMRTRLLISQSFPFLGVVFGIVLLIRQLWILFSNNSKPWPQLISLPLSLVDMTLLVAGGFVVLGEVLVPAIVLPLTIPITKVFSQPVGDSLKVLIGYGAMTFPPLIILRQQIKSLRSFEVPPQGWLQWRLRPFNSAIYKAIGGWLMILPLVLFISWLTNFLFGDQGGSNPLLEMVLNSKDPLALSLLVFTTVVFAPLFEELIFRGALLPVLAKKFGLWGGIFLSAFAFAVAHLSVGELPPLFVLGVGLALMRLSTGRLLPCVLMHSFWNGVTFFSLLLLGG